MWEPRVGQFMIALEGEGHDDLFDTLEAAQEAAKAEVADETGARKFKVPVAIVMVVDVY